MPAASWSPRTPRRRDRAIRRHRLRLFNRGKAAGIGFSYVISTGNEADLNMADFLDYMVEDATHALP